MSRIVLQPYIPIILHDSLNPKKTQDFSLYCCGLELNFKEGSFFVCLSFVFHLGVFAVGGWGGFTALAG